MRTRPMVTFTLAPDTVTMLAEIAEARCATPSRTIDALVREAHTRLTLARVRAKPLGRERGSR